MAFEDRQALIEQICVEANGDSRDSLRQKLVMTWRTKLAQEPYSFLPHQIDQIMRGVWDRLKRTVVASTIPV